MAVYIPQEPPKKIGEISSHFVVWPSFFVNTKDFPKKYKESLAIALFLLSFVAGRSNQLNFFVRMLHFTAFSIDTHIGHNLYHMAIWPYFDYMATKPFGYMSPDMANMGVYRNTNTNAAI